MRRMFDTRWVFVLCFCLVGWSYMQAQTYEKLWKQVEQAQEKSLPQTVVKLTGEICRKALAEKNSPQLLKAYLCQAAYQERLTPDSLYSRLNEMEQWVATEDDEADRAILHSLLASEYADYWQSNRRAIVARTDLATVQQPADIREWTSRQFVETVDAHAQASVNDMDVLVNISTDDYSPLVVQGEQSNYYGHDLYHLLARKASAQKHRGTYKYQGAWQWLDHIIVSGTLLQPDAPLQTSERQANVFTAPFLLTDDIKFGGMQPFRTYYGMKYQGGFSDHLPVYTEFRLIY